MITIKKLAKLHVELVKLQEWVKFKGLKVCIVLEGRDGAGKGGVITHLLSRIPYKKAPRVKVELPKRQNEGKFKSPDFPFKYVPEVC